MLYVVGSNSSPANSDPSVPFEGTRSGKTLASWLGCLGVDNVHLLNVSGEVTNGKPPKLTARDVYFLRERLNGARAVIALGSFAAQALKRAGVPHFRLPHPSGRNRLLNDPKYIESELKKCRAWLSNISLGLLYK